MKVTQVRGYDFYGTSNFHWVHNIIAAYDIGGTGTITLYRKDIKGVPRYDTKTK
jgi:hypothetical protein